MRIKFNWDSRLRRGCFPEHFDLNVLKSRGSHHHILLTLVISYKQLKEKFPVWNSLPRVCSWTFQSWPLQVRGQMPYFLLIRVTNCQLIKRRPRQIRITNVDNNVEKRCRWKKSCRWKLVLSSRVTEPPVRVEVPVEIIRRYYFKSVSNICSNFWTFTAVR